MKHCGGARGGVPRTHRATMIAIVALLSCVFTGVAQADLGGTLGTVTGAAAPPPPPPPPSTQSSVVDVVTAPVETVTQTATETVAEVSQPAEPATEAVSPAAADRMNQRSEFRIAYCLAIRNHGEM